MSESESKGGADKKQDLIRQSNPSQKRDNHRACTLMVTTTLK